MSKNDVKKIVDIAFESVKELDEPLKTEGFKLILSKLLDNDFKNINIEPTEQKKFHDENRKNNDDPLDGLAKVCECSKSDLVNVIDFEKENFVLLKKVDGANITEKVQNTSLCILTAWMKGKEAEWVDTQILNSALYNSGISNLDVGKKLRKKSEYFSIKGKKKGAKYRLTALGWQKGVETLKSLIQN